MGGLGGCILEGVVGEWLVSWLVRALRLESLMDGMNDFCPDGEGSVPLYTPDLRCSGYHRPVFSTA